jgi:hypothetical protein
MKSRPSMFVASVLFVALMSAASTSKSQSSSGFPAETSPRLLLDSVVTQDSNLTTIMINRIDYTAKTITYTAEVTTFDSTGQPIPIIGLHIVPFSILSLSGGAADTLTEGYILKGTWNREIQTCYNPPLLLPEALNATILYGSDWAGPYHRYISKGYSPSVEKTCTVEGCKSISAKDTAYFVNDSLVIHQESYYNGSENGDLRITKQTTDSLFLKNKQVWRVVVVGDSVAPVNKLFEYDSHGNVIKECVSVFDVNNNQWGPEKKERWLLSYDEQGRLVQSVHQDSLAPDWCPNDTCHAAISHYTWNSQNLLESRDSSGGGRVYKHFFIYEKIDTSKKFTTSAYISENRLLSDNQTPRVSSNGRISLTKSLSSPMTARLLSVDGKVIHTISFNDNVSIFEHCSLKGLTVGKGVYLLAVSTADREIPQWTFKIIKQ